KIFTSLSADEKAIATLQVGLDEIRTALESINDTQKKLTDDVTKLTTAMDRPTPSNPTAPTLPVDNRELFAFAESKLRDGVYKDARAALREYIKRVTPKGERAEDAQYDLGESYYLEKAYQDATREYSKVLESYPEGKHAADALFKLGLSAVQLGTCSDAEVY